MAFKQAVKAEDVSKKGTAPVLDAGVYPARILSIVDLATQPGSPQYPDPKRKLEFRMECLDEFMVDDAGEPIADKPRTFNYEVSYNEDGYMHEKSSIYKLLAAIPNGFTLSLADMLGAPVSLMLTKYVKKSGKNAGKDDNKIVSVLPMKAKDIPNAAPLVGKPLFFDFSEPDVETFNKLFKGNQYAAQDRIKASTDYPGSLLAQLLGEAPANDDDAAGGQDANYDDDAFEQAQSNMGEVQGQAEAVTEVVSEAAEVVEEELAEEEAPY
jgi:hypothetical protein